jgi:hypothetical protein
LYFNNKEVNALGLEQLRHNFLSQFPPLLKIIFPSFGELAPVLNHREKRENSERSMQLFTDLLRMRKISHQKRYARR